MRALVTGAAGFIGSHLVDRLVADGWRVLGVDDFDPYYARSSKESNLADALRTGGLDLLEADLATLDLLPLLEGVDVVFHTAGQPGVRGSWGKRFDEYLRNNVSVTQRLLEAARATSLQRFVFSSSSSVYGDAEDLPVRETASPEPTSPYGVTKLAAEHLCGAYARTFGIPVVSLRYFTVYGPRQRPDMAIHRLIQSALTGTPFPIYGSGEQRRDFTYVSDVVDANLAAVRASVVNGTVVNIGGGATVSLNDLIDELSELLARPIELTRKGDQAGDVRDTSASIERARTLLDWSPGVDRRDGLRQQIDWHLRRAADETSIRPTRPIRPSVRETA